MKGLRTQFTYCLLLLLVSACSALKHVPPGETLYTGSDIHVHNPAKESAHKVKSEASDILRPKPNTKFLGSRPKLWVYYKTEQSTKGLKHWLNKKVSEPPVYKSQTNPGLLCKAIDARLFNIGYFESVTTYTRKETPKTVSYEFTIEPGSVYTVTQIEYPKGNDSLSKILASFKKSSLIQVGSPYNLDILKQERDRIDTRLKNRGFFYFNPEYLQFKADTSLGQHQVKVILEMKPGSPAEARQIYTIKEVNIYAEYPSGTDQSFQAEHIDSTNFYSPTHYIRSAPILQSVFLKNNKVYSRRDHNLTLSRLQGLGVYKFVNVQLSKADSTPFNRQLNANILLTPRDKKSINYEVQGTSKSNNFIGPGVKVGFRNRNALGGAELLILNVGGSFETQFNGQYKGQYTYEFNPKVEFYVPRFMLPFSYKSQSMYVPKTKYILDFSYLSRVNYYNIKSVKFSYGYKWKNSQVTDHDLSVLNVNYFNVYKQSADFLALIAQNPSLDQRFEKQFIAGMSYSFTYNEQLFDHKKNPFYINPSIEFAGTAISTVNRLLGHTPNSANPLQVLGVNYAQFVKLDLDMRQLFKLNKQGTTVVATRLFAGWALPFGNASTIPFIRQYFSGGAYSLRGFPIYSVGPGTYVSPDSIRNLYFIQQGGEIKLEGNVEYRYTISGMLKGALFADAGNTWLNKDHSDIPGGKFSPQTFMKELAVSIGTGLRFDIQFFVIRLDLGIPVRKPWYPDGNRWVFNEFDLGTKQWRKNNLIFNLAFGYPF